MANDEMQMGAETFPLRARVLSIEFIFRDQRRRWASGERIFLESYFENNPTRHFSSQELLDLIYHEILIREGTGEHPGLEEYATRFPDHREELRLHFEVHDVLSSLDGPAELMSHRDPIALPAISFTSQMPRILGFEIVRELGRGGMGVVYLARQIGLNRLVALKMILPGASAAPEERLRLQREAEAIARLQHPNVVQIFQVGEEQGQLFLALEYLSGGSLRAQLAGQPLPARAAAALVETLALAIEHTHEHGIIHRDLKPANVLLTSPMSASGLGEPHGSEPILVPKITDFGLAKLVHESAGPTRSNDLIGTLSYMAPELVTGGVQAVGPAVDIYGLGAILYESLTGRPPFLADSPVATLQQIQYEDPVSPSRLQTQIPRDLATICLKCLEKKARNRYSCAGDLAADPRRFLNREPIRARPPGPGGRLVKWAVRQPVIASLCAGLVGVTCLGFAGILWQWWRAEQEVSVALEAGEKAKRQESSALRAQERAESQLHFNRLALAQHEFEAFRVGQAAETLAQCPPGRRDWEWRYLDHQCHRALFHLTGPTTTIQSLAFSPDGHYVAAGCGEWNSTMPGELLVWDLRGDPESPRQPIRQPSSTGTVYAVAFHPDGKHLASTGADFTLHIWEWAARPGQEHALHVLRIPSRIVSALDFSPCGKYLAIGCNDGSVLLLDTVTQTVLHKLAEHKQTVFSVKFSPDCRLLASGSRDGTARLWEMAHLDQNTQPFQVFPGNSDVRSIAFHPNGQCLAVANWNGNIKHFDLLQPNKDPITCQMRSGTVFDLAFSPDGRGLAWCGSKGPVEIGDYPSCRTRIAFRGHDGSVKRVAFSPDGGRLATAGANDRSVCVWNANASEEPRTKIWPASPSIVGMAFSPDGEHLALAGGENRGFQDRCEKSVRLWEMAHDKLRSFYAAEPTFYSSVAFHPDGRKLAAGGENAITTVWNVASGEVQHTLKGHCARVTAVAYRKGGDWLATASADGTVILWHSITGQRVRTLTGHTAAVTSLAFHPDGILLASASADQTVKIWDLGGQDGRPVRTLSGHTAEVSSVVWSPDGRYLASASTDQILKLYDAEKGLETVSEDPPVLLGPAITDVAQRQEVRTRYAPRLAFSPQGLRLASVSDNRPAQIWVVPTAQKALSLTESTFTYLCLAFDPTGRRLVASTGAGLVIWDSGSP